MIENINIISRPSKNGTRVFIDGKELTARVKFVRADSPRAAASIRRHLDKLTDRSLRAQVSSKRAQGILGRKAK